MLSSLWSSKALSDVVVVFTVQPHAVKGCLAAAANAHSLDKAEEQPVPSTAHMPRMKDVAWPEGSAVFEAHGIVLCTNSEYFEAQILRHACPDFQDQQLCVRGSAARTNQIAGEEQLKRVLVVGADNEHEVAAAEHLMRLMYQQHTPKLEAQLLLQVGRMCACMPPSLHVCCMLPRFACVHSLHARLL